jgi:hypothetical protein
VLGLVLLVVGAGMLIVRNATGLRVIYCVPQRFPKAVILPMNLAVKSGAVRPQKLRRAPEEIRSCSWSY